MGKGRRKHNLGGSDVKYAFKLCSKASMKLIALPSMSEFSSFNKRRFEN